MTKVLITGGTGLIGVRLREILHEEGYEVAIMSRGRGSLPNTTVYHWDPEDQIIDRDAVNSSDFIIHLAGANIGGKRWTTGRKQEIRDSRIKPVNLIYHNLDPHHQRLKAFISASAIGFYGARTTGDLFRETDPPASDFLGETCLQWEHAADQFTQSGIRTVKIRTGIVLSKRGGALKRMQRLFRWGLGSAIGSGKQYMPWIHIDDLCRIYIRAMEQQGMAGAYNGVAPEHVSNRQFSRMLARAVRRPFWFPRIPAFVMKLLFGEMSAMLLKGSRISSERTEAAGFVFQYPRLEEALREIYSV